MPSYIQLESYHGTVCMMHLTESHVRFCTKSLGKELCSEDVVQCKICIRQSATRTITSALRPASILRPYALPEIKVFIGTWQFQLMAIKILTQLLQANHRSSADACPHIYQGPSINLRIVMSGHPGNLFSRSTYDRTRSVFSNCKAPGPCSATFPVSPSSPS